MSETPTHTPKTAHLPESWGGEMRALLRLGVPMALTQLVQFSIYFVDTVMIGRLSPEDLAGAALGSVMIFLLWMLASGPIMAVSPLVSQALGADQSDTRDPRRTIRMTIWIIFLMTPLIFLGLIFTEQVALALGQDPTASAKAQSYVVAVGIGLPFTLATMALRNFLAALDKTFIPLLIIIFVVILNIGLNALLIFGLWGFPRLELVGAGLASSIAGIIGFFIFLGYIAWDKRARSFEIFKNITQPDWERLKDILRLGWPISVTTTFEGMLFNAIILVVGLIGVIEQAAYQIALNAAACAYMMPWGMSMAGAVRIGLARGAGNRPAERRAAGTTIIAALIAIGIIAIPVAISPNSVAALYLNLEKPENQQVIAYVVSFLPIAAAFMFWDAIQAACNQLLRGLKDVTAPMWICGISYWLIGFPIAYYLGLHSDLGAKGVWYGLMVSLICAAIGLGIRLRQQLAHPKISG
jgi:MATE family multidrug resistance protein